MDKIHAALSRSDNRTRRVICETLPAAVALAVGFGEAEEMATDFTGANAIQHLSETETTGFKQWAWDHWTPGDVIHDPPGGGGRMPVNRGRRLAWRDETRRRFLPEWYRQADRDDSDNYWASFEHAGGMFDLCAYWTGGNLAVVVYECFKQGIDGNNRRTLAPSNTYPERAATFKRPARLDPALRRVFGPGFMQPSA